MRKGGCRKVLPGCRRLARQSHPTTAYQSATLPQGRQASRCGGAGLLKPSRPPWMRKGGCRKAFPVCRCLALVRFTSIHLALNHFAAFASQLVVSPQGVQPSRCGGASGPILIARFYRGAPSESSQLVKSSAAPRSFYWCEAPILAPQAGPPKCGSAWFNFQFYQARESSDNPIANAFCRVAPSVRFRVLAIFFAGVFLRARVLSSRTCTAVQARFFFDPFFIKNLHMSARGVVAVGILKEKSRKPTS